MSEKIDINYKTKNTPIGVDVVACLDVVTSKAELELLPNDSVVFDLILRGPKGNDGALAETYESVSKNIKSWGVSLSYSDNDLSHLIYTNGSETVTKTLNYTSGALTSIVLSGDVPSGIDLTKTLSYTGENLTAITYS